MKPRRGGGAPIERARAIGVAALALCLGPASCGREGAGGDPLLPPPSPSPDVSTAPTSSTSSASSATPPAPFLPDAWPEPPPALERVQRCDKPSCPGSLETKPGEAASTFEQAIGPGSAVTFALDPSYAVVGVVLDGSVHDEPVEAQLRSQEPAPARAAREGFYYGGAGLTLRAAGAGPARVFVAVLRGAAANASKVRPGGAAAIRHFDLKGAPLVFQGGKANATIALETRGEEKLAASCTLLGIGPGGGVAEHVHAAEWELLAIVRGEGTMTTGSGEKAASRKVKPGSLVAIPAGTPHAFQSTGADPVVAVQLYTPPGPEQRFKKLAAAPP